MNRILFVQYANPAAYPPLQHSSRIMADSGDEVLFLGIQALPTLKFRKHERIRVKLMSECSPGWKQKLHYLLFSLSVFLRASRWRPQVVYASDYLSSPIALALSLWPNLRVVYHEHDSPSSTGESPFRKVCLAARRRLSRRVLVNVLPNERRSELFAREMGGIENVACVWNCPTVDEIAPSRNGRQSEDLWLLYHGSIVPVRLPLSVVAALALLPNNVKLRVIGYETIGHLGYVEQLRGAARRYGVAERIQFLGTVPNRIELMEWCRKSDIGLGFMPKSGDDVNEQNMIGASNKTFEYLAGGLALLVTDDSDWRSMYVEPGYAIACDTDAPESIASSLKWFLDHPEEMRAMGEMGRHRILNEWNYERQFQPVLACLQKSQTNELLKVCQVKEASSPRRT